MGRIKLDKDIKKKTISVVLDIEVFTGLESLNVKNKSKLINELLKEHFSLNQNESVG